MTPSLVYVVTGLSTLASYRSFVTSLQASRGRSPVSPPLSSVPAWRGSLLRLPSPACDYWEIYWLSRRKKLGFPVSDPPPDQAAL